MRRTTAPAQAAQSDQFVADQPRGGQAAEERNAWLAAPPRTAAATWGMRAGVWAMLACGPVALLAALGASSAGPAVRPDATTTASPVGPAGFAELYVAAYLRSGSDDPVLKSFFPQAPALTTTAGQRVATRTTTVAARQVSTGYWAITVAADVSARTRKGSMAPAGTHYFTVAVITVGQTPQAGTSAYVATALPAEVAALGQADEPGLGYSASQQVSSGPLADTVHAFAAAYLTGSGELARYLSPGTQLQPVDPPPYASIDITAITAAAALPGDPSTVPVDGTRVHILVAVDGIDAAGQRWPLQYALTLAARAGRWEVAALDPAPALDPTSRPAAATPTPADTGAASPTSTSPAPSTGASSPAAGPSSTTGQPAPPASTP